MTKQDREDLEDLQHRRSMLITEPEGSEPELPFMENLITQAQSRMQREKKTLPS